MPEKKLAAAPQHCAIELQTRCHSSWLSLKLGEATLAVEPTALGLGQTRTELAHHQFDREKTTPGGRKLERTKLERTVATTVATAAVARQFANNDL